MIDEREQAERAVQSTCISQPTHNDSPPAGLNLWIQTCSGKKFDLLNPDPASVDINDVVKALGATCRFNGHCRGFYSVLNHSVLVCEHCNSTDPAVKFQALLHDAAEAYYGDITRPFKMLLCACCGPSFDAVLERINRVVAEALRTTWPVHPTVKHADNVLLATEAKFLMCAPPEPWCELPPPLAKLEVMSEEKAIERFWWLYTAYWPLRWQDRLPVVWM